MVTIEREMGPCPDADALMEIASARSGLSDFGDPSRKRPLESYVSSLQRDAWAGMSNRAREVALDYILHHLGTRLQLIADRKTYPEISKHEIRQPFIIVGPPRSGSTLLHTLISQDPDNMAPEHWICLEPSPPVRLGEPSRERLDGAHKRMMALFDLIPDIFVTHPYMIEEGAGALAECGSDILNMVFTCQELWCFYGSERYRRYLLEGDHRAALGFHHDFLQHLQWGDQGKRWALKGSDHLLWLGELAGQYPDAMLIWTHRDLAQQLGSLASVQSILGGLSGHPVSSTERKLHGRLAIDHQCASFLKGMRTRDALGEDRFMDVSYHDVMADPMRTVARIYERFGLKVSDEHATNIRNWIADNPQTKHGAHKHSPEEFGMDADAINRQFKDYVDRFGFGFGVRPPLTE
jgi:hypothetical protein